MNHESDGDCERSMSWRGTDQEYVEWKQIAHEIEELVLQKYAFVQSLWKMKYRRRGKVVKMQYKEIK